MLTQIKAIRQDLETQNNWDGLTNQPKFYGRQVELPNNLYAKLSDYALNNLSTLYDIPSGYLEKCPAELIEANLNHWSRQRKEPLLFRGHDFEVDAVLTRRYVPFNNYDVIRTIEDALEGAGDDDFLIDAISTDRHSFHLRLCNKEFSKELMGKGDEIVAGIGVTNSETGKHALSVTPLVYRMVCSNGLIVPIKKGEEIRHIHRSEVTELKLGQIRAQIKELIFEKRDVFDRASEMMLKGEKIGFDPFDCSYCKRSTLQQKISLIVDTDNARRLFDEFQGHTVTDFTNHLTQKAQDYPFEKRIKLERYAGRFLAEHVKGK